MATPVAVDLATQTRVRLREAGITETATAAIRGWNAAVYDRAATDPEHAEHVARALARRPG
jgi:hypothetical protein